jgi:chemotaxis protein methyltransferase CheR
VIKIADYEKLCDMIYRRAGISIDIKKYMVLKVKIELLMGRYLYVNFRSFFHDLRFDTNKELMQELMNVITVNETYFYREAYQFDALVQEVLPKLSAMRPMNEPLRILCAPSSTGEEPYTIALSLLDEDQLINQRDVEIIGLDIDSTVIHKAKLGFYLPRSVQFIPKHLLDKYFTEKNSGFQTSDFIRSTVNFQVINIMDKVAMKKLGKFDAIFCRNMLIYFDDVSRKEVAMTFYEMLNPKGVVFLGHAESINRIVSVYKTAKSHDSIYYVKE